MFDPEDFAKLAARLVQSPCGPADARTAISRAYYAAFLYAKEFLDPHFYFSDEGKVHTRVNRRWFAAGEPARFNLTRGSNPQDHEEEPFHFPNACTGVKFFNCVPGGVREPSSLACRLLDTFSK